jgi:hypothetical protein
MSLSPAILSSPSRQHQATSKSGFTLFATTWALAGFFHQLSFVDWRWHTVRGGLLTAALLWCLLKPSSWKRFAALILTDWIVVPFAFPAQPNHIFFAWIMNATLLSALVVALRNHGDEDIAVTWYRTFAPWVQRELFVLYAFAVVHKLNVSYFNLASSCGATMYQVVVARTRILPSGTWADYCAIYGTLVLEAAIPLLLLRKNTRTAGVIVGMVFHGVLALDPYPGLFSFSATMTALFSVFVPAETAGEIRVPDWLRRMWPFVLGSFGMLCAFWVMRSAFPAQLRIEQRWDRITQGGFVLYYVYLAVGLFLLLQAVAKTRPDEALSPGRQQTARALVVFPVLMIVSGIGPYIGLRTESSFSMFSNVQTEPGRDNHLVIPSAFQVTDWQTDLVEIVDSSDGELRQIRDNGQRLPYLDLRRRRQQQSDLRVTFKRNGAIEHYDAARPETYSALPGMNWFLSRYFYFRPVDPDPAQVRCKH